MDVLKKRPFCGGEAKTSVVFGRAGIVCTECDANIRMYLDASMEDAVKAWNNRKPVEDVIKFKTTEEMARDLAEKALDEYMYEGKTVRQWAEVLADYDDKQTTLKRIVERLEEELNSADAEKERCARENPLQFDSSKGYATGIYNAIEITKEELM